MPLTHGKSPRQLLKATRTTQSPHAKTEESLFAMTDDRRLRQLCDRAEIHDCLMRYCRGVDRLDRELVISAYHADALDDHGVVVLPPAEFADWAFSYHSEYQHSTQHAITNVSYDIVGDQAHIESYYTFWADNKIKPNQIAYGRYIDRFERRNGEWRIAARVCVTDAAFSIDDFQMDPQFAMALAANGPSRRDRQDLSYERPLVVPRPRD
jgi:hypothetical protein